MYQVSETGLYIFIIAVAVDMVSGIIPGYRKYVFAFLGFPAATVGFFLGRLNRQHRTNHVLRMRGVLFTIFSAVLFYYSGRAVLYVLNNIENGHLIETFLVSTVIGSGSYVMPRIFSGNAGKDCRARLADMQVPQAAIAREKDIHGINRLYIEQLSISYLNIVCAAFFYLVPVLSGYDGLPFLLAYSGINAAVLHFRFAITSRTVFSETLFLLYGIIVFVPSVAACVFLWIAAVFVPQTSPVSSFLTVVKESHKHRLSSYGRIFASFSGALNVTLGGRDFDESWIGPDNSSAKADDADTVRGRLLYCVGLIIIFTAVSAIILHRTAGVF